MVIKQHFEYFMVKFYQNNYVKINEKVELNILPPPLLHICPVLNYNGGNIKYVHN